MFPQKLREDDLSLPFSFPSSVGLFLSPPFRFLPGETSNFLYRIMDPPLSAIMLL